MQHFRLLASLFCQHYRGQWSSPQWRLLRVDPDAAETPAVVALREVSLGLTVVPVFQQAESVKIPGFQALTTVEYDAV
jgi:hypothetical protein